MKRDNRIEELKKKYFSEELRTHFEENHKSMQKNIQIFKDLKAPSNSSVGETSLLLMLSTMGEKIWEAIDMIDDEMEGVHLLNIISRKRIENLEKTLVQQGTDIDRFSKYDDILSYVDNYLEHSRKEGDE